MSERTELRLVYAGIVTLCVLFWGGIGYAVYQVFA